MMGGREMNVSSGNASDGGSVWMGRQGWGTVAAMGQGGSNGAQGLLWGQGWHWAGVFLP